VAAAFSPANVKRLPDVMVATVSHAMGIPPEIDELITRAGRFTLDVPGFLKSPRRTPPILAINGALDTLVPIEDLKTVSQHGIQQKEMIYQAGW
jgi:hypothetical protein